mgnify:CR=1 FL=1
MKTPIRNFAAAIFLLGTACAVQAQEFRVGFVNTDRIFREAKIGRAHV